MQLSPRYDGPPVFDFHGPPADPLVEVRRQRRRLESALRELDATAWATPSRCDGWTAREVVAHLVSVNEFWHLSVVAGSAGTPTRSLGGFDPAATPPQLVAALADLSADQVLDRFVASDDALLEALEGLDDAGWSALAEAPPGHIEIRRLADHALWDAWIHERDILVPLGSTPPVEADEVIAGLRYVAALGPALGRAVGLEVDGRFALEAHDPEVAFEVDVGDTIVVRPRPPGAAAADQGSVDVACLRGDGVELLEALSLRRPLPAGAPPEWATMVAGLAAAFDAEPAS